MLNEARRMFSKACEYGIKASLFIAEQSGQGERVSLKDISEAIDSPTAFTAKILQQLSRNSLIQSVKGPAGGYEIDAARLDSVWLADIVKAIDGDQVYKGCGLGLKECNEARPCPVHEDFKEVRERLREMLETTSLKQLADGLLEGTTFLR